MGWGNKFPDMKNDPSYLEGRLSNAETSLAQIVYNVNSSGFVGDGTTADTIKLVNGLASLPGNVPVRIKFPSKSNLQINGEITLPNYAIIEGNRTEIKQVDSTKNIFTTSGYEVFIRDLKLTGGKSGVYNNSNNVDRSLIMIKDCIMSSQSDYQIKVENSASTLVLISGGKYISTNGVVDSNSDLCIVRDIWLSALTPNVSYFINRSAMVLENILGVPEITSNNKSSYWIKNLGHTLRVKKFRFGGENSGIVACRNEAQYDSFSGVPAVLDFDKCDFWGSNTGIELASYPNSLTVKDSSQVSPSGIYTSGSPSTSGNIEIDSDIPVDPSLHIFTPKRNINGLSLTNLINSNSYGFDFTASTVLGTGGTSVNTADNPPFGVLSQFNFGTSSSQMYFSKVKNMSALSAGIYTFGIVAKVSVPTKIFLRVGKKTKEFLLSPSDQLSYVYLTGYISAADKQVEYSVYNAPANATVTVGSPYLFYGVVNNPIQTTPGGSTDIIVANANGLPSCANIPQTGYWYKGVSIDNSNKVAGGYMGWTVVTTGNAPGCFKGFGAIQV